MIAMVKAKPHIGLGLEVPLEPEHTDNSVCVLCKDVTMIYIEGCHDIELQDNADTKL